MIMEEMKFYTEEEMLDKHIGKIGSPHRNQFEDEINTFLIGEAIKEARKSKKLTQVRTLLSIRFPEYFMLWDYMPILIFLLLGNMLFNSWARFLPISEEKGKIFLPFSCIISGH